MSKCIEVSTARTPAGYGMTNIWIGGGSYRVYAHRIAWEQEHGPIPPGMVIMHNCDNPSCVNIEHLVLGTQGDNARDMADKGRHGRYNAAKTHCSNEHEFTAENTYLYKGKRECRACRLEAVRRYRSA